MIKKILNVLTSKPVIISLLILVQLIVLGSVVFTLSEYFITFYFFLLFLSIVMSIHVINKDDNPNYKMTWIMCIMTLPVFGGLLYLLFGGKKVPKELRVRDYFSQRDINDILEQEHRILEDLKMHDPVAHKQANYIWKNARFPIYDHTETTYFKVGEEKFTALLNELKQAKHYIFMEYFIIQEGSMWNPILEVLKQKVQEGVDVRLMYDDAGCIFKLPKDYHKVLSSYGIKAKVFNPLQPRLAMQMNNRDHRKIVVIDGVVGFTGGINLADEYININSPFGHWKDVGVMLKGAAVWNFTLMFLQFWDYDEKIKDDYLSYRPDFTYCKNKKNDGYVQPFSDSPTDNEHVGEYSHINMVNSANDYVYAQTPYLIIDNEMKTSLILAAKNGIDVRIMVPHIPDKRYAFMITRSNYESLLKAGVKIYEYTPGFVHAKTFVVDDKMAIVGTINMDYRSYYLHYECGVWFYKSKVVNDLKEDYLNTLTQCHEVTLEEARNVKFPVRLIRALLNLLAPMM